MIYFLLPVYNEEPNIKALGLDILNFSKKWDIKVVFVNDGSTDNTVNEISKHFQKINHKVISLEKNQGPGAAFNEGFKYILSIEKDMDTKVVTMESDATSDIEILSKMIQISDLDFDLVLASVYAQGGGFEKTTFFRLFLSRCANGIIKNLYGIRVNTYTSFYRIYKLSTLNKISNLKIGEITSQNGFLCKLDILRSAIKVKTSIIEVPVKLNSSRRKGKSKMKIWKTIKEYLWYFVSKK